MKDIEPRGIPPQYRPEDLGIDPVDVNLFSLFSAVGRYLKAIPKGAPVGVAVAVLAYAASQYTPEPNLTQLPQVEISAVSPEPTSPIILSRAQRAQNMIDNLQDPSGRSFYEIMRSLDHQVGRVVDYSHEPRWGIVGDEGLYDRSYPSAGDTRVVFELGKWLGVGRINAGEKVGWDAEIDVRTGNIIDRFGLLIPADPESDQLTFIRIGRSTDGVWDLYVKQITPQSSFSVYLPVIKQRLPDGSADYGNGVIGPSLADQLHFNPPPYSTHLPLVQK